MVAVVERLKATVVRGWRFDRLDVFYFDMAIEWDSALRQENIPEKYCVIDAYTDLRTFINAYVGRLP